MPQSLKLWGKLWSQQQGKQQEEQHSSRTVATADSKNSEEDDVAESPVPDLVIASSAAADVSSPDQQRNEEPFNGKLELAKLMIQAETALNAGALRESLSYYEQAMELLRLTDDSAIAQANVCYTSSRIAKRLGDFQKAYRYTAMELSCVKDCACSSVIASNHSELAQMCHYELGDSEKALQHYKIALGLHCGRLQECRKEVSICCRKSLCAEHKAAAAEIKASIQETKQCIGRIQFGMGMVADALRML